MTNTMNAQQAACMHALQLRSRTQDAVQGQTNRHTSQKLIFNWTTTAWFTERQLSWEYKWKPAELRLKAGSSVCFTHGPLHGLLSKCNAHHECPLIILDTNSSYHRLSPWAYIVPLHTLGQHFLLEVLTTIISLILHCGEEKKSSPNTQSHSLSEMILTWGIHYSGFKWGTLQRVTPCNIF